MKTRRFFPNKLVRDAIVKIFEDQGVTCSSFVLEDDNEYLEALTQKLIEELQEVFSAESNEELIEELADIEEVLLAFKKLLKISPKDIEAIRAKKHAEKGGFEKRLFLEYIDVPESNKELIKYYEKKFSDSPEFNLGEFMEDDEQDEE